MSEIDRLAKGHLSLPFITHWSDADPIERPRRSHQFLHLYGT